MMAGLVFSAIAHLHLNEFRRPTFINQMLMKAHFVRLPSFSLHSFSKLIVTLRIRLAGLSTTLGAGVFVVLAFSARESAGPSVVLSFLIAAVASCLGGEFSNTFRLFSLPCHALRDWRALCSRAWMGRRRHRGLGDGKRLGRKDAQPAARRYYALISFFSVLEESERG